MISKRERPSSAEGLCSFCCGECNGKHHGHCKAPSLRNETIEDAFIKAVNQVLAQKAEIIRVCEKVMAERCDTEALRREMVTQQTELEVVTELMERLILTNASVAMDQEEYSRQFAEYEARYNALKEKRAATEAEYTRRNAKRGQITKYLSHICDCSLIASFNETLWYGTVEQVRVTAEGKLRFIFKGGQEVTV